MEFIYITQEGERLDLNKLNKKQRELLRTLYGLYSNGHEYIKFFNAMNSSHNLKIMGAPRLHGQYWINLKVLHLVIFQVLQDLGNRLAVKQHFLLKQYKNSDTDFAQENEKVLKEFLQT